MNTVSAVPAFRVQPRIYFKEAQADFLTVWRTPGFTFPTLFFPIIFYLFFGVVFGKNGSLDQSTYLLATYGTFGVMGPCLNGFGLNMANERAQGWLLLKRVSPMPISAYFIAKICTSLIFSMVVICLLFGLGVFAAGVNLEPWRWAFTAFVLLMGSLPLCALGLAIGSWVSARSASAVVNLVYLPMGLFAGLWMPIQFFPDVLQSFATVLPAWHLAELALIAIGMNDDGNPWLNVIVLAAQTAVFLLVAFRGFRSQRR